MEGNHKKLKDQLNNSQQNATSAASMSRELDQKSIVDKKGANITTIETIVKMEKDMKLIKVKIIFNLRKIISTWKNSTWEIN